MKLGYNRVNAGIISKYVYDAIKWNDIRFLDLGLKMTKDNKGLFGDNPNSTLKTELMDIFF